MPAPQALVDVGPLLQVQITVLDEQADLLRSENKPIPSVEGHVMIDTGAKRTAIDIKVAERVGLPVKGRATLYQARHLPYLATAPGYAQELLIVNRGAKAADLWLDDLTSNGTDPASLVPPAAPETLAKEFTQTLAVTDLVDLGEGGEEGSATLSINAASRNVDVLTILTNQATGSTDTVQHAPEPL